MQIFVEKSKADGEKGHEKGEKGTIDSQKT